MILTRNPLVSACILAFVAFQLVHGSPFGRLIGSNFDSFESDMDGGSDQDTFVYQKRLVPIKDLAAEASLNDVPIDDVYDHLLKK